MVRSIAILLLIGLSVSIAPRASAQGPPPIPPPGLRISEIMYNPPGESDSLDFIELRGWQFYGIETFFFSIEGFYLDQGVSFTFPAGAEINHNGRVIVAKDSIAFENTFGIPAYQWNNAELSDTGETVRIRLSHPFYDELTYSSEAPWPVEANGLGKSIVQCNENESSSFWTYSLNNTGVIVDGIPIYADPGEPSICMTVGLNEQTDSELISIYPNPASTNLTIESRAPLAQIWVRDVAGRPSIHHPLDADGTQDDLVVIDLSSLPSGIYLVEVLTQNGQRSVQKVVVQ